MNADNKLKKNIPQRMFSTVQSSGTVRHTEIEMPKLTSKFLEFVKKALPSATFGTELGLPVWVAFHGHAVIDQKPQFDPKYPFVGEALALQGEGIGSRWNELLIPWPAFLVVVARPGDGTCIEGWDGDDDVYQLVYACDEVGTIALDLPADKEKELEAGLLLLRDNCPARRIPTVNPCVWNEGTQCEKLAKSLVSADNSEGRRSTFPNGNVELTD